MYAKRHWFYIYFSLVLHRTRSKKTTFFHRKNHLFVPPIMTAIFRLMFCLELISYTYLNFGQSKYFSQSLFAQCIEELALIILPRVCSSQCVPVSVFVLTNKIENGLRVEPQWGWSYLPNPQFMIYDSCKFEFAEHLMKDWTSICNSHASHSEKLFRASQKKLLTRWSFKSKDDLLKIKFKHSHGYCHLR